MAQGVTAGVEGHRVRHLRAGGGAHGENRNKGVDALAMH